MTEKNRLKSVPEIALKWNISERNVRNYCNKGRIPGAQKIGGIWYVPDTAVKPGRLNRKPAKQPTLLEILRRENRLNTSGGIYHKVQIELAYNSNHIEGSRLSHDQTRYIFETNTIIPEGKFRGVSSDDIIETANHFRCVDYIIDNANRKLSENMVKTLHFILKNGTSDSREEWFNVGDYKKMPNEVGGMATIPPENVHQEMKKLLKKYNSRKIIELEDLLDFHQKFESIHPFQDGNGRVGRLILFKECLTHNITPFIIDEELKLFYYRGLREWGNERGYLIDTCLAAQDKFKKYLDYFQILAG